MRTRQVYKMLLAGYSRAAILDYASDAVRDSYEPTEDAKHQRQKNLNREMWDICDKQIDERIRAANKIIDEQAALETAAQFNMANARLEDLYLQSYTIQDYKTCAQILKQKAELYNLNRTAPHDPAAVGAAAGAAAAISYTEWSARADDRRAKAAATYAAIRTALASTDPE